MLHIYTLFLNVNFTSCVCVRARLKKKITGMCSAQHAMYLLILSTANKWVLALMGPILGGFQLP